MKESGEIFTSHYERSPFKNLNLLDLNSERELDMATKHIFDVFQITHRYQNNSNEVKRVIR